jgi:SAM-dependent methyltransferase
MTSSSAYVGTELHLFREAHNWKRYLRRQLRPYLRGDVLEIGAGIGGTTRALHDPRCTSWTCLEPDPSLTAELIREVDSLRNDRGEPPRIAVGSLENLEAELHYDAILYIDVLEHIEDDRRELAMAARRLRAGGHIVVMSPAHAWLYTPFDEAIGHFRRYTRATLQRCSSPDTQLVRLRYLDSVGILASLGNRLVTRASMPTEAQIGLWDKWMVPLSRWIDPLLAYRVGKSVLAVWRR